MLINVGTDDAYVLNMPAPAWHVDDQDDHPVALRTTRCRDGDDDVPRRVFVVVKVNGLRQTPIAGWRNPDNSPSSRLARSLPDVPVKLRLSTRAHAFVTRPGELDRARPMRPNGPARGRIGGSAHSSHMLAHLPPMAASRFLNGASESKKRAGPDCQRSRLLKPATAKPETQTNCSWWNGRIRPQSIARKIVRF
jgi:hypothetical protein